MSARRNIRRCLAGGAAAVAAAGLALWGVGTANAASGSLQVALDVRVHGSSGYVGSATLCLFKDGTARTSNDYRGHWSGWSGSSPLKVLLEPGSYEYTLGSTLNDGYRGQWSSPSDRGHLRAWRSSQQTIDAHCS